MKTSEINFAPLKNFSKVFILYRNVKRARMIALRVAIPVLLIVILAKGSVSIHFESSGDIVPILVIYGILNAILFSSMGSAWFQFSVVNEDFQVIAATNGDWQNPTSPAVRMKVPSFKGKIIKYYYNKLYPITGTLSLNKFGLFTRLYKEGGILRWRERQMDTIMWMDLPKDLPHIVIDSTANESARRSNLAVRFNSDWRFQFEGIHGTHYNVYVDPHDRVATLQLFTPDVLDVLYEKMPGVDIEILGGTIWFVKRYGILNDVLAASLFSGVEQIMPELSKQITGYQSGLKYN